MSYLSNKTGPEIDAAVALLGDIQSARDAAAASATSSLASKSSAATSETNALASKNAAATSATNASASETSALASKNAAANSATNAAESAAIAASSAASISSGPVTSINGKTGAPILTATDVGATPAMSISNKTAAYTVVTGDLNKIINCTSGVFTVDLAAAATLGVGFSCWVWNTSASYTDTITIDPNASETIDGVATLKLGRGEGVQIICDGVSWQTGSKKAIRGYAENFAPATSRASATVNLAVAIGAGASASNTAAIAMGFSCSAAATYSAAIGNNSAGTGSQVATGSGAMALGGSYASGVDSFAAAIGNNTSSYGSTGANSVALGERALASGNNSSAVGGRLNIASGTYSTALGGFGNTASGQFSIALGGYSVAAQYGKRAFASGQFVVAGDAQAGNMVLRSITTNTTPAVLTSDGSSASTTNQVILPNYSTFTFRIQVVAMQKRGGGSKTAGYEFTGVIVRGPGVASVLIKNSTKNVLYEDDAAWDCNVSADDVNGGLAITVTGAAATNIVWVATVDTTEVTYL